jgi:DmsE family decaheme c-type cytochrome
MALSAMTAKAVAANSDDASFSALREYVQSVATTTDSTDTQKSDQDVSKSTSRESDDGAYPALRDFARRIGGNQAPSIRGATKLAQANSLFEFLQQRGSAPQAGPMNSSGPVAGGKNPSAPVEAHFVGAKVCMTCHADKAAAFGKTLMGRIGKTQKGKFDCENCHGPGSAHVKAGGGRGVGGIISFRPNDLSRTAEQNNAICLGCHERGDRTYWNGSTHETRGLMCTNCHTIMKAVSRKFQLKTAFELDTCFQCHKDRRAQMYRSSHMPWRSSPDELREAKIVCSNCHNPHGSQTLALLRGDSINDTCYKCHAEKRGPFLFEHAPVRENCDNCHVPHGSVNEFLLRIPRQRLCSTCHGIGHGLNTGPLAVQSIGRSCQNCHNAVHGTNSPSGALLHR